MKAILETEDLVKYYGEGENQVRAIDHTSMQVQHGEFVAVVGRSGSGKVRFFICSAVWTARTVGKFTLRKRHFRFEG